MSECLVRWCVGECVDGTWYAVKEQGDGEYDWPTDWIAEGVGTWERAMWWAWNYLKHGKVAR